MIFIYDGARKNDNLWYFGLRKSANYESDTKSLKDCLLKQKIHIDRKWEESQFC